MARLMSRSTRRTLRNLNSGAQDVKGFIDENPVTSAVLALAAGVATTSVVKMAMNRSPKPKAQAGPKASRKAGSKARPKAGRKVGRKSGLKAPTKAK